MRLLIGLGLALCSALAQGASLPPPGVFAKQFLAWQQANPDAGNAAPSSFLSAAQLPGVGMAGMYPGMNPMALGNRMASAATGNPPYGMDCCSCLANEEDYRVYPNDAFLQVGERARQYPGMFPGMSPYAAGTRMMTASMGLPPYGMDCCPCLGNEEDYRVYPVEPMLGQF